MKNIHSDPAKGQHCPANRWNPRTWSAGKKVVALILILVVLFGVCAMLRPDLFFAG